MPVCVDRTGHLLTVGVERVDKYRNESAFGENGFRRSGPRQVMFAKRAPEKMKLGSNEQSCRNGFLAEISSGDRPVLSVFHEIRCHQANIGTFIRKDSNHAGTSPNFTIQSLNHVGR